MQTSSQKLYICVYEYNKCKGNQIVFIESI